MTRYFLLALLLGLTFFRANAQQTEAFATLSDEQWTVLIQALESEDWLKAADYAAKYIKQIKEEDEEKSLARLRYMFIYASAGKVLQGKMTYEELDKALKAYVGKEVVTPARPIVGDCKSSTMAGLCFPADKERALFTAATNKHGTNIHAFEYVQLQENFDYKRHEGKFAAIGGTVTSFMLSPNQSRLWAMRIFIEKGYVLLDK